MKTVSFLILISPAAIAQGWQNADFSFLFGGAHTQGAIVETPGGTSTISGSAGFVFLFAGGYEITATKAGSLYLEVPTTYQFFGAGTVQPGTVTGLDRNSVFFTPGVRFKVPTGTRVSFYGVLGGGAGFFNETYVVINGQVTATGTQSSHWVLEGGGGMDVRISRWLSLRIDSRDFVSFGPTHNHVVALIGFAFHL